MVVAVTGMSAPWYPAGKGGSDIAVAEINAAGGVLGRPVELVVSDDKSTVEGAVQALSFLTDVQDVDVITVSESDAILAILQTIKDAQLPTVCPGCGTSELDEAGGVENFVYRFTASDSDLGLIAAQFARDAGFERMSMIVQNTEGASSPADRFKEVFTERIGGEILADVRIDPGQSSYQAQVDQAFAPEPDAVYLGTAFEAGGIILQEWQRRGYGGKWLFASDLTTPEIEGLSQQGIAIGGENARVAFIAYDEEGPTYQSYAPRYTELTGDDPSSAMLDANAYDAFITLALAIEKAGSTDGPAISAAFPEVANAPGTECYGYAECLAALRAGEDINYQGASSNVDVNEFGNLVNPIFSELQIIDGMFQVVENIVLDESLR
jgi:branched-chain amino acid transport system substrate-binding protein